MFSFAQKIIIVIQRQANVWIIVLPLHIQTKESDYVLVPVNNLYLDMGIITINVSLIVLLFGMRIHRIVFARKIVLMDTMLILHQDIVLQFVLLNHNFMLIFYKKNVYRFVIRNLPIILLKSVSIYVPHNLLILVILILILLQRINVYLNALFHFTLIILIEFVSQLVAIILILIQQPVDV